MPTEWDGKEDTWRLGGGSRTRALFSPPAQCHDSLFLGPAAGGQSRGGRAWKADTALPQGLLREVGHVF